MDFPAINPTQPSDHLPAIDPARPPEDLEKFAAEVRQYQGVTQVGLVLNEDKRWGLKVWLKDDPLTKPLPRNLTYPVVYVSGELRDQVQSEAGLDALWRRWLWKQVVPLVMVVYLGFLIFYEVIAGRWKWEEILFWALLLVMHILLLIVNRPDSRPPSDLS
jgi:hypothetical protein